MQGELQIGLPMRYQRDIEEFFIEGAFAERSGACFWQKVKVWTEKGVVKDDLEHYLVSEQNRLKGYAVPELEKPQSIPRKPRVTAPKTQKELERAFEELLGE